MNHLQFTFEQCKIHARQDPGKILPRSRPDLPKIHARFRQNPRSKQDPSKIKARCKQDPTKVQTRSRQDSPEIQARSNQDQRNIHPRSKHDPSKIQARSIQADPTCFTKVWTSGDILCAFLHHPGTLQARFKPQSTSAPQRTTRFRHNAPPFHSGTHAPDTIQPKAMYFTTFWRMRHDPDNIRLPPRSGVCDPSRIRSTLRL